MNLTKSFLIKPVHPKGKEWLGETMAAFNKTMEQAIHNLPSELVTFDGVRDLYMDHFVHDSGFSHGMARAMCSLIVHIVRENGTNILIPSGNPIPYTSASMSYFSEEGLVTLWTLNKDQRVKGWIPQLTQRDKSLLESWKSADLLFVNGSFFINVLFSLGLPLAREITKVSGQEGIIAIF